MSGDRLAGTKSSGAGQRLTAAVTAVALGAAAVIGGTEAVLAALGRPAWLVGRSQVRRALLRDDLSSTGALVFGISAAALGVLLLLAAVGRGTPPATAADSPDTASTTGTGGGDGEGQAVPVTVSVERKGLAAALRGRTADADGVRKSRVSIRPRSGKVTVRLQRTPGADRAQVEAAAEKAVTDYLTAIAVRRPGRVKVTSTEADR